MSVYGVVLSIEHVKNEYFARISARTHSFDRLVT